MTPDPKSLERELGEIATTLTAMAKLHEGHQADIEALEVRSAAADGERAAMKEVMSSIGERMTAFMKESKEQSVAINLKLDALQQGFNRLAGRTHLKDEAVAWVNEQHAQHALRRETDLQVTRARATAWTWPAIITLVFAFITVTAVVVSLVHH